jgi:hypothetical protein
MMPALFTRMWSGRPESTAVFAKLGTFSPPRTTIGVHY